MTKPFSYEDAATQGPTAFSYEDAAGVGGKTEKPKDPSLIERAAYGAKRMVGATRTALTDSPDKVGEILADQTANAPAQSSAAQRMQQEIKPYVDAANASEGVVDTVKSWGALGLKRAGQLVSEPRETMQMVAEQIPNSLPGMAGGLAGAKAGAALGSLVGPGGTAAGAVIGGVAGGLAGGYLTEKGSSIQEQVQKKAAETGVAQTDAAGLAGVYRQDKAAIDEAGALKGVGTAGTDAVLNVLTLGLSGVGRRALSNEIAQTYKAVKAGGISAADGAKQLAALEARHAAQNTLGQKALRGSGVVAGEMGGEALSEGVGQKLAYGSVDAGEVIDEGLLGFGQGAAMGLASGAINKIAGTPEAGGIDGQLASLRGAINTPPTPAAPTGPGAVPPAAPPMLGYNPAAGTHTVFPDGSIVLNSDSSNGAKTVRDMQRAQRLDNADNPFFGDPTPSQSMGLEPTQGPSLANAAILSVDSGIQQAIAAEADPYNAPLSALGQELAKTNQRLRQEADALGLDTDGLHGDAARMTEGKSHEDYLTAANDQLRKAMKAAKELPYEGQRSTSEATATGGEAASPDTTAGKAPAGDASGQVGPGAVRLPADRVGEHGQRPAGTDGGGLPGAVGGGDDTVSRISQAKKMVGESELMRRAKALANDPRLINKGAEVGGVPADAVAMEAAARATVSGYWVEPPSAVAPAEKASDAKTTTSAPAAPAAGLPAAGSAPVQAAGVSSQPSDDQILTGKRAAYQALKKTGAPEDVISASVIGYQEKADKAGAPMTLWRSKDGALGLVPAANKSPFALGEKIGTIYPTPQSDNVTALQPQGTTANVPQPAQPGTQASQAPSAQGAAPAGTAVASPSGPGAVARKAPPNSVIRDVRGHDGKKLGDIVIPHDGTKEGILRAAVEATKQMDEKFGRAATFAGSRTGATDKNGNPAWVVDHGTNQVVPFASKEGDYIWGDLTAAPGNNPAKTIDDAAHQAATSPNNALPQPTDGQKKAGNYAKGHVNLNGLDLSIENPAGSTRSGTDKDGKAWKNTLKHHYGYIKGTVGNDKDHVDLFVKPETPLDFSGQVFVIDQHHPHNGKFDEHKVMVGFANAAEAKKAYHANYAKGWKGMKSMTPMAFDDFKTWVKDGAKNTPVSKDPAAQTQSVQPQGEANGPQADQAQQAETQRTEAPAATGPVASEKRRGEVGGMMSPGEVVTTATGRDTTPFPKIKLSSNRATGLAWKATAKWLMDNAIEEAKSRGDTFAQRQFEAGQKYPQQADKDSAEVYLFGQTVNPVPKPFLKPLVDPATNDQQPGPAEPVPDEPSPLVKAMNDLMDVRAKIESQGRVVDDRLVSREAQLVKIVSEIQAESAKQDQPESQVAPADVVNKPEAKQPEEKNPSADKPTEPTAEQIAAIGDITIEIPTETGTAKMTVNATKALAAIDERLDALEMVKRCLA